MNTQRYRIQKQQQDIPIQSERPEQQPMNPERRRNARASIPQSLNHWLKTTAWKLRLSRLIVSDAYGILVGSSRGNIQHTETTTPDEFWDRDCLEIAAFTPIAARKQFEPKRDNPMAFMISQLNATPINIDDECFILASVPTYGSKEISSEIVRDMCLSVRRILTS